MFLVITVAKYKKQWDVDGHDVCDSVERPDKTVQCNYENEDGARRTGTKNIKANRVPIPMQQNIVGKAVTFLFGNKVQVTAQTETNEEKTVLGALTRILDDNKNDSQNRVIAKNLFRSTQVAEVWYADKVEEHEDYGFSVSLRIRMSIFSPWFGDNLYPYFDERGNMIAFSREYTVA